MLVHVLTNYLEGDPRYTFSYLRAGDVIAYSLLIPDFQTNSIPLLFETVISLDEGSLQVCSKVINTPTLCSLGVITGNASCAVTTCCYAAAYAREKTGIKLLCKT